MNRALIIAVTILLSPQFAAEADSPPTIDHAVGEINRLMETAWQRENATPAARSSDAEFARRIWLDIAGVAPPISEIRAFLKSTDANKRAKLIDRLLLSPQHATHMAATWNDVLLPADAQVAQQRQNINALQTWLRDQFIDNTPYDYFVASFLTAGGAANRGPAIFYTTREVEPKKIAAATSKIFLGIQLQCAECHDHPFDRWTQKDFWSYTAFFGQLQQSNQQMNRGGFIIDADEGEVTLPDSDDVVSPRYPGVDKPPEEDITNNRRRQLTIWMASRDNQYFVRAAVNRVWANLYGRGLVDPVDAMDKDNPPSHPEVLDYLANFFVQHRFNMRTLMATIARTDAYQLSSRYTGERPNETTFAVMNVKTLSARQYYDSVKQNIHRGGSVSQPNGIDIQREQFLNRMRTTDSTPRDYPHGVMQALGVMNGPEMAQATQSTQNGLLSALQAPIFNRTDRIETIYLAALSRLPNDTELQRVQAFSRSKASESTKPHWQNDLLWALLNTAEAAVCP